MRTVLLIVTCLMLTGCFGPPIMYVGGLTVTVVDIASIPAKNKIRKEIIKNENEKKALTNNEQ
tara:strand:- start:1058 stop:1246 length:189 start_codon:yes stop_codon:yes gene_type:complete